jgi:hypothetical protein
MAQLIVILSKPNAARLLCRNTRVCLALIIPSRPSFNGLLT